MNRFGLGLVLLLSLLAGCAAPSWSPDGRDSVAIADLSDFGPRHKGGFGQHGIAITQVLNSLGITSGGVYTLPSLSSLGATLENVVAEGNTTGTTDLEIGTGAELVFQDTPDLFAGRFQAGGARFGTATGLSDGTLSSAALGARQATTDVATAAMELTGPDAIADSTATNKTGSAVHIVAGRGTSYITVTDYASAGTNTIVITTGIAGVSSATTLTNGTEFTAATSDEVTAGLIATAITDASIGLTAAATGDVVNLTLATTTSGFLLAETGASWTVTNGTDGEVTVGDPTGGDTFRVQGTTDLTIADGILLGASGSPTANVYSTNGDPNTGVYFPGADQVGLAAAGSQQLIMSSGTAKFGRWGNPTSFAITLSGETAAGVTDRDATPALLSSGGGTGAGADGYISFSIPLAGASGTSLQSKIESLRITPGVVDVNASTDGGGDGILRLAALGARAASSDVATVDLLLTGMDSVSDSTASNLTGSDVRIAPGSGTRWVEIIDFTQVGDTITVTVDGSDTVLTENTDFNGETSDDVTATNLAVAIDAISGVSASATLAVVNVTLDVGTYQLVLAETGVLATVTNSADGAVVIDHLGEQTALKVGSGVQATPAITFGDEGSGHMSTVNGTRILTVVNSAVILDVRAGLVRLGASVDMEVVDDGRVVFGVGLDRFIQGEAVALVDDAATEFVAIQSALGDAGGVVITYTCKLTDATGVRATKTGTLTVATLDGAAGVTVTVDDDGQIAEESGTTTWAFAVDNTDDGDLEITCQTTTDLSPTAITITWTANGSGDITLAAP